MGEKGRPEKQKRKNKLGKKVGAIKKLIEHVEVEVRRMDKLWFAALHVQLNLYSISATVTEMFYVGWKFLLVLYGNA